MLCVTVVVTIAILTMHRLRTTETRSGALLLFVFEISCVPRSGIAACPAFPEGCCSRSAPLRRRSRDLASSQNRQHHQASSALADQPLHRSGWCWHKDRCLRSEERRVGKDSRCAGSTNPYY